VTVNHYHHYILHYNTPHPMHCKINLTVTLIHSEALKTYYRGHTEL